MRHKNPNLARRPFVNKRPVLRISILLWGLGIALFAFNVFLYWSFSRGQDVKREKLEEIRASIDAEENSIQSLRKRLASIDLDSQNEQVAFLNQKIQERTFGWSLLFDTLAEILPDDVRVVRLSLEDKRSSSAQPRTASRRRDLPSEAMHFGIQGEARDFEALLSFIDALNASPAFDEANLARDSKKGGLFQFRLAVDYYPSKAAALHSKGQAEGPEAEATSAEEAPPSVAAADGGLAGDGEDAEDGEDPEDAGAPARPPAAGLRASGEPRTAGGLPPPPRRNPLANPLTHPRATDPSRAPAVPEPEPAGEPAAPAGATSRTAPAAGGPATVQVVGGAAVPGGSGASGTVLPDAAAPPARTPAPSETGSAPPAAGQPSTPARRVSEPEAPDTLTTRPSASGAPVLAPGGVLPSGPLAKASRRIR